MAISFLDKTGLTYFWSKLKAYIASLGYITASDSITGNAATATKINRNADNVTHVEGCQVGKALVSTNHTDYGALFNAPTKNHRISLATYPSHNDRLYIVSATNEDIEASTNNVQQWFTWDARTGEVILNRSSYEGNWDRALTLIGKKQSYAISISDADISKGSPPSDGQGRTVSVNYFGSVLGDYRNRIACLDLSMGIQGTTHAVLRAYDNTSATSTANCAVSANMDANGNPYTYAPTPPDNDNTTQIATCAWVQRFCTVTKGFLTSHQSLSNYIDKTSDQTGITGSKTFENYIHLAMAAPRIFLKCLSDERGGILSGNEKFIYFRDKDNYNTGFFGHTCYSTGTKASTVAICAYDCTSRSDIGRAQVALTIEYVNGEQTRYFRPVSNNNQDLGTSQYAWRNIFANNNVTVVSDERAKTSVEYFPDTVLDAWSDVGFVQFLFRDAVAEKGEAARLHSGVVAQRVLEAFAAHGLDARRYGLLCYDSWDAKEWDEPSPDGSASVRCTSEAGDRWSIRYAEALCLEAACQRRRAERLEARVASLEARLASAGL